MLTSIFLEKKSSLYYYIIKKKLFKQKPFQTTFNLNSSKFVHTNLFKHIVYLKTTALNSKTNIQTIQLIRGRQS